MSALTLATAAMALAASPSDPSRELDLLLAVKGLFGPDLDDAIANAVDEFARANPGVLDVTMPPVGYEWPGMAA